MSTCTQQSALLIKLLNSLIVIIILAEDEIDELGFFLLNSSVFFYIFCLYCSSPKMT